MPEPAPHRYASVAVPTPLRTTFQYALAEGQNAVPGSRVLVPFGSRKLVGVVTEVTTALQVDTNRIKTVHEVLAPDADLPLPILKLCEWAANYYQHAIGEVVSNALPVLIRKGGTPAAPDRKLTVTAAGVEADPAYLKRAPAQRRLLEQLNNAPLTRDELAMADFSSRTIKSLIDKNWAVWVQDDRVTLDAFTLDAVTHSGIEPTDEQNTAVNSVDNPTTYLLEGVTGSGKTEVYFQVIEPLLRRGLQILVLVPEIGLTPQTITRFKERFDVPIAVLHSGLNDRERAAGWQAAKEGSVGIVLGTRSAIFTPLLHPGAIIVDEEHDTSYKQQDGFRYSARDLAVLRGQFESVPVILGSATPSLESLHNAAAGKYQLLSLTERPAGAVAETYELIDTRHLERHDGFTRLLRKRIGDELAQGNQVLVFLNRRGFAPVMMCEDCQWISQCKRCDARLTYHLTSRTLVCHHCGSLYHNVISCQACGGNRVSAIGLGTQRIEQTLKEMFPGFPVLRIDRDTTRRQGAMEAFVATIGTGEPALLVGTQLLAKGHHFPNVTLVALLDIDAGFYSSDFKALERMGQLILQVGGRAGRAEKPGTVLIQSEFAGHSLLQRLVNEGYRSFAEALLKERQELDLPPYTFNALIRAEANDQSAARLFLDAVVRHDKPDPAVNLLGPVPALMEKKAGRFRQILILASESRAALHRVLKQRIAIAESLPEAKKVRWAVDVDPSDLF